MTFIDRGHDTSTISNLIFKDEMDDEYERPICIWIEHIIDCDNFNT